MAGVLLNHWRSRNPALFLAGVYGVNRCETGQSEGQDRSGKKEGD